MPTLLCCLLMISSMFVTARSLPETPQQSLNQYVAFLNQSVDEVTNRFQMLQNYQADVTRYRKKPDFLLRLPSSGPLEEYYYQKSLVGNGLTAAEKQRLTARAQALWLLLTKLDQTGKALEIYIRLNDYERDNLKQSDALIDEMRVLLGQFSRDKESFYKQIGRIYRRYQPYEPTDPYLSTEKAMERVLLSQQQLLDSLPYYLNQDGRSDWPIERVQRSMLADAKLLSGLGAAQAQIAYPASSMITHFSEALQSIQALKRRAIDNHTFAAQQSARHGNEVYQALLTHYNQDLVASHQAFVKYSQSAKRLLDYPKFSPIFAPDPPASIVGPTARTVPFQDQPPLAFSTKPAASPASKTTFLALNAYVDFINESLQQMHLLQGLLRSYQASANAYRDPSRSPQRADLTYSPDEYKVPKSMYQLLLTSSQSIPVPYRASVNGQAEVLLTILTEMNGLRIELITYTTGKQYLQDGLQRSDAILDRYAYLFNRFDERKEHLYNDIRRIHESYPAENPASAWYMAGNALLKTLDDNKEILFSVKAYLTGETGQLPATDKLTANVRVLITAEYENLKGLQRYGRSNGLCPYSPYEDLAGNSLRFAKIAQAVNTGALGSNPYEPFYYFYNNELVYQYNKFSELAKVGVLKAVNQPDIFAFRRFPPANSPAPLLSPADPAGSALTGSAIEKADKPLANVAGRKTLLPDTVYVERTKVDTVYLERAGQPEVATTLTGFAPNNMVLLLDVSGSMDSPVKLPLLKQSVKSLLTLLRPEDQLSIVVYSGKARVVLKPTSGAKADEIARVIDALESGGDTDGNEGLRLAYKVASKHYIRAGNNRIVLATDGEFPVRDEVLQLIGENARQDVFLTVFTFGRNPLTGRNLKKLSELGRGTYRHVTSENASRQLIREAQATQQPPK